MRGRKCFNEAPALHGGRPAGDRGWRAEAVSFNEAPALHGGRLALLLANPSPAKASMRPPHYTGEDVMEVDVRKRDGTTLQ